MTPDQDFKYFHTLKICWHEIFSRKKRILNCDPTNPQRFQPWRALENSGRCLKSSGGALESSGRCLESSGRFLESSGNVWRALGDVWKALVELWRALGDVWRALGGVWGALESVLIIPYDVLRKPLQMAGWLAGWLAVPIWNPGIWGMFFLWEEGL